MRTITNNTLNEDQQKFSLLGTDIPVRASDNKLVDKAFERVKEKVESIRQQARQASKMQVALLAAMNLAGEMLAIQKNQGPEEISPETEERLETLKKKLLELEV